MVESRCIIKIGVIFKGFIGAALGIPHIFWYYRLNICVSPKFVCSTEVVEMSRQGHWAMIGHESGAFLNEITVLIYKRGLRDRLSVHHVRTQETVLYGPGRVPFPNTDPVRA